MKSMEPIETRIIVLLGLSCRGILFKGYGIGIFPAICIIEGKIPGAFVFQGFLFYPGKA